MRYAGSVSDERAGQDIKADSQILSTERGMETDWSFEQPEKVLSAMVVSELDSSRLTISVQPENAPAPIFLTLFGMTSSVNIVQFLNAPSPISSRFDGRFIASNLIPSKASLPILIKVEGKFMLR